jgi:MOSC domain-containing protein YiiM
VTDRCEVCGFSARDHSDNDLLSTVRTAAPIWQWTTDRLLDAPQPLLALAAHTRDALVPTNGGDAPVSLDAVIAEIQEGAEHLNGRATGLAFEELRAVVADVAHTITHDLFGVGRAVHALGAGAPTQHGAVVQINASGGGVPKTPIDAAWIDYGGLDGDQQADRRNHGRPFQAVCLWCTERIDGLRVEGHPIHAGSAGENLTVTGLDWDTMRPGVVGRFGQATLQLTAYATPCSKNAQWFADRDFRRIDQSRHRGWSRVYARVLEPGSVRPGDTVVIEPE